MANERRGSAGQPPAGGGNNNNNNNNKKKRPAPTIDLTADEIQKEPEPVSESARAAAAEMMRAASEAEAAEAAEGHAATDEPRPPRPDFFARETWSGTVNRVQAAIPESVPWTSLGAGAIGALAMVLALWLFGALSDDDSPSVVENCVLRIEGQVRDLARIQSALDPRRIDDLSGRVTKLEVAPPPALTAPPRGPADPAIENRLGAAEEIIKAIDQNVADLTRRGDEINGVLREMRERVDANTTAVADLTRRTAQQGTTDRSEADALGSRIAAAELALRTLQADLARLASGSPDRSARLAVTASGLRASVERGDPFSAELAAVKSLGVDAKALAPLEPFAQAGVPSTAVLARDYAAVSPELQRIAGAATGQSGGILDRLQANAEKLVRIRPIDESPGDDPRAIVSRVDARVANGDLAAALGELAKLPPAMRAPAEGWIKKVEARNAAIDASRRVASDAVAAVAKL